MRLDAKKHPALLLQPDYAGTLASVRCLAERGIPVTLAGTNVLSPARWSCGVTRCVDAPPVLELEEIYEWLLDFGEREPGHVLYPTCDSTAWLMSAKAAELSRYYKLYSPSAETMLTLLDKKALYAECERQGLPAAHSVVPESLADAIRVAPSIGFPLLLKTRTQAFMQHGSKGAVVVEPGDLPREYATFCAMNSTQPLLREAAPDIELPMLQAFVPDAAAGIYSISGFIARGGQAVARAAVKVLQRPRRLGVGLCFEERPLNPELWAGVRRLCETLGYFGAFEAEFVPQSGGYALIDFNPRFYGQMGFDVARKVPQGYLAWLGAIGDEQGLREELDRARTWQEGRGYAYCDRFFFNATLTLQRLSGVISAQEYARWRAWFDEAEARGLMVDSFDTPTDKKPRLAAVVREIQFALRHPRSFYRRTIVDS